MPNRVGVAGLCAVMGAVGCDDGDAGAMAPQPAAVGEPPGQPGQAAPVPDAAAQTVDPALACEGACDDPACRYVPALPGACVNEADLTNLRDKDFNVEWNDCVVFGGCQLDVDCNTACFAENTGVSSECSVCFAEMVPCLVGNCGTLCQGGMTPDCSACIADACLPAYNECFGELVCPFEYGCRDLIDNDGDGATDAADPECADL